MLPSYHPFVAGLLVVGLKMLLYPVPVDATSPTSPTSPTSLTSRACVAAADATTATATASASASATTATATATVVSALHHRRPAHLTRRVGQRSTECP